jgi:hypothetical protein
MARTIADLTTDIKRLERMLKKHRGTHLDELIRGELITLIHRREERLEARAERRAERHAEMDDADTALAAVQAETDMSHYLKNLIAGWDEELDRKRARIDE